MLFQKQTQRTRTILVDGALVEQTIPEKVFRFSFHASLGTLLLGLLFLLVPLIQHANTRVFYPSVCLGDWEHPESATGEPGGIGENGLGSAILQTADADIFCSAFVGSPASEEKISYARLTFSWHVGALPKSVEVPTQTEEPIEQITEPTTTTEESAPEEVVPEVSVPEETQEVVPDETPPVEPEPVPQEEAVFTGEIFSFVPRVYAEEVATNTAEGEMVSTGTPQQEVADAGTDEAIVRVSYTLDGSEWYELGVVTNNVWQETTFEVPVTEWSDIERLQILVQGIEAGASVPVYLDAMQLSVVYERVSLLDPENLFVNEEEIGEVAVPYIPPDVPEYIPEDRVFGREISIDPKAVHSCRAETFPVDITGVSATTTRLFLVTSSSTREQLEIGSVPEGIDVTFGGDKKYVVRLDSGEPVPVSITKKENAQKGSFAVPVVYTAYSGKKESTVVCQVGIVNE